MHFAIKHILIVIIPLKTCADSERVPGSPYPAPWKITKAIRFISNTGPEPLENHKAFNVGPCSTRQRKAITPFKWCFADRPMMAHLKWYWDHQQSWSRLTPFLDAHGGGTHSIFRRRLYVIHLINAYLSSNNKAKLVFQYVLKGNTFVTKCT